MTSKLLLDDFSLVNPRGENAERRQHEERTGEVGF